MSAKWLGIRKIKLATIVVPGGFARRKKEPHVRELAESIARAGVISLPVIDAKTRRLVAGGDRLAALMLNKVTQHEMRLVQGTPEELEELTITENLRRRRGDDYDGMTARLVELVTGEKPTKAARHEDDEPDSNDELPGELTENTLARPAGRPKTDKGAAREEVAKRLGKTPEAIRSAEKRARKREAEAAEALVPEEQRLAERPPVTTYGVTLSTENARAIVAVQELIDQADSYLRRAQGALTTLKGVNAIGASLSARIQASMHQAADAVRRERPDSICPCCKLIVARVASCTFCGGLGVVSNDKLAGVAAELLVSGAKAVVPDGRGGFVPYARESGKVGQTTSQKVSAAKGARKLRIEDEHGQEIPVDDVPAKDI